MKRKITIPSRFARSGKGLHQTRRVTTAANLPKADPTVISDAMYKQDIVPFREGFDVLAQEMARALPQWTDKIKHDKSAERAGLLLRTMRNAAGLSQAKLGEKTGIKQSDISALETGDGKQGPTYDVIARVADACGFYITFAAKTVSAPKVDSYSTREAAVQAAHHWKPVVGRVVRTYVMDEGGALQEFEGTSPALKKDSTIILDDSAGHTYKVSVEGPARAKVAIEEAESELAAAVQQVQSAAG